MEYSLGLYEKALPGNMEFPEKLCLAGACGFDRLELSIDESDEKLARLDWPAAQQRELGALARQIGVPIRTMCLSGHRRFPLGAPNPEDRRRSMEMMRKAIEFSVNAGISVIQLAGYDTYYQEGNENTVRWFEANLRKAADYAGRWGVCLGFETMETSFMDTVEKAMRVVRRIDSPWLGVYPDIGNLKNAAVEYGTDVADDLRLGAGHIFAMHLKETKPGVYRDMLFGEGGHTEYERCIAAGLQMGVRLFTGEFWYRQGQDNGAVLRAAADFLRGKIEAAVKLTEGGETV